MFQALLTLIAAGESRTLELKKSTAEIDRACRSLCALVNGQGGQVVFGVTPAGKVVGQKVGKSESAFERAIRNLRVYGKLIHIGPAKGGQWEVL